MVAAYRQAKGSGVLALDLGGFASVVALQCAVDSSRKESDLNRIIGESGFYDKSKKNDMLLMLQKAASFI